MDKLEGLKREQGDSIEVNRVIGGRQLGKNYRMNRMAVAAVNEGKTVAIYRRDGMISFKPFGDYVAINFHKHERP